MRPRWNGIATLLLLGPIFLCVGVALLPIVFAARRLPPGDSKHKIVVGGVTREYALHVPVGLSDDRKVPLLLVFHGGGGHAWSMPHFTHFDGIADENQFVVAYPESTNKSWNDTRELSTADDVGFIRALIDDLEGQLPIDPSRVYAAGISNGGFFSNRLACDLSDKIAAIASVAATMPTTLPGQCHPSRPISVLFMNGTKDPLVPISGGPVGANLGLHRGECISLKDGVAFWTNWDRTAREPSITQLPDTVSDGTHVSREVFTRGTNGTEVVVYRIQGGGHTWPGGPQYAPKFVVGKASQQIDGSRAIWEFLKTQRLR